MRSVFKASFIAVAATIIMLPVGAQSAGLLGDGGLLGTGIGTPTGALGTGLLASNDGGSSGGGVLGTGIGAPGGALGTGLLAGSGDVAGGANVKLGQNGGVLNATTADAKLAGVSTNLLVDLFGSSNPRAHVALGGGLLGDGLAIDLSGSGTGGGDNGGNGGGGNGGGGLAAGNVRVASLEGGAGGLCFTPDAKQIAKLVNRHAYVNATFATWAGARSIKVISIRLCPDAAAVIASQRNINRLQSFVSTQASLAGRLQGHSAAQVIGVDRTGDTLVVYVM